MKPPTKYHKLVDVLMKQRKFYRDVQRRNSGSSNITPERIQILEEIGVSVRRPTPADAWQGDSEKVKEIHKKYGHCCVTAIPLFSDDDLERWVYAPRKNLKATRKLQHEEKAGTIDTSSAQEKGSSQDGASNVTSDEREDGERPRKRKKRVHYPQVYFTNEMCEKLASLKCPYMDSFEDQPEARVSKKSMASQHWYSWMEEFRKYVADHENGLIAVRNKKTGLPVWVREQRRVYDLVESGDIETCDTYEVIFVFLKSLGFAFDREIVLKEDERIRKEKDVAQAQEKVKETTAAKLEAA